VTPILASSQGKTNGNKFPRVGVMISGRVGDGVSVRVAVVEGNGVGVFVGVRTTVGVFCTTAGTEVGSGVATGVGVHAASISNTIDTTKIRFIVRILLWVDSVRQGLPPRL